MPQIQMNKSKNLSVEGAYELFIRKCRVKNLSQASITSYQNKVQPFVDYCNGGLISSITIDTVDGFTNLLKTEHNVNDVSVVSYLRSVRAFLYYCMECNYMTTFKIHLPKAQKEIKETYSNEQLEKLLAKPDINTCSFAEFKTWVFENYMLATGNRLSTALNVHINGPYLATKKIGKNNPKAEQIEKENKLRMDWNREVDRAIISEVSMDDILQIKREHITEPVKRSIERYGNKPETLSLILNMAIAELVLLITKVLEAIKGIHSRQQRENAPEDKNKAQKQDSGILTADALPPEPVMTPEAAAYPKLKKIKTELDSQNAIIFEAEKLRGSLEIEMSNLKGLAKLTRKGDLQRKIDEKTDYINRLKVGLSNMVRNSGFENMNEFLLTFRECRNAYTDYQRQYESWKNACRKPDTPTHKDEKLSDKLARLQREAAERQNSISRQTKNRGAR